MKKIKGCIFDLDGVIVDTAKYHYLAWKEIADELGFEFTKKDNEKLKGVSRMDSLDILLQIGNLNFDEKTKIDLAEKKNKIYVSYISKIDKSEILEGVEDFIKELKRNNIKIALGSVSKNAVPIIKNIGMLNYFDSVIDGNKITKAKPDPEVFLLGAKELNLKPENCVVFEDAVKGIQAAKNAGMYAVGVGDPLILKQADKVIPGFKGVNIDILNF
ncbi:MAG TPA: beta-phosphoglucomutase [Clostridiaceae bacterium]|jgi:beta-phosphoglucomutase|nr:beta-phosphoglucomutase [Clostridiaceae bacterium]HBF77412.1 beta-phosphoglucomutase [Clostridiaceae bacterium]HBG39092.1 beta-phosphoglucomutase [Clostridiaceae bacterium]HBN28309.1 beta-phosphoglucomutase [Clostridiaceae bacterium]HBX48156.1 beta-phosphoglucomutase [Clostridiaceae bacterium]